MLNTNLCVLNLGLTKASWSYKLNLTAVHFEFGVIFNDVLTCKIVKDPYKTEKLNVHFSVPGVDLMIQQNLMLRH